ncbi:MAG: DUF4258 domain-containing protein [Chitinophagales bacterium]
MNCTALLVSGHALIKMFARSVTLEEVKEAITNGEIIKSYPEDIPYPSFLLLKIVDEKVLHVVVAKNPGDDSCILITVYEPDEKIWSDDFKSKR